MAITPESSALATYLATRRSVPSLNIAPPAPDDATLSKMLEIAARVPDHGKLAPWRFIRYPASVTSRIGDYLSDLWRAENPDAPEDRLTLEKDRFRRAPLVIGVVSKPVRDHKIPIWEQELSAGAVCLNLIHAAHAFGFSAQWLTEWYSYNEKAARYLGIDEGERFAGFIHIGTPTISPSERERPSIPAITSFWSCAERQ